MSIFLQKIGQVFIFLLSLPFLPFIDKEYYFDRYPDVDFLGFSAPSHYVRYGVWEGRRPNGGIKEVLGNWTFIIRSIPIFITYHLARKKPTLPFAPLEPLLPEQTFPALRLSSHIMQINHPAGLTQRMAFNLSKQGNTSLLSILLQAQTMRAPTLGVGLMAQILTVADITRVTLPNVEIMSLEDKKLFSFTEPPIFEEPGPPISHTVEVPAKWLATVKNAYVTAGFQVVSNNRLLLYEPSSNPLNGFVAGTWRYIIRIKNEPGEDGGQVCIWFKYKKKINLPEAILISGRCSPNYFHCLIEYFTRVLMIAPFSHLQNVPLIIDAELFPQEIELLKLLCPNSPLYFFEQHTQLLEVETLHIPSVITYLPDTLDVPLWEGSTLCYATLQRLRTIVLERLEIDAAIPPTRKIFLVRRAGRNITNAQAVEDAMIAAGYEVIEPGSLSFAEQVRVFASATHLVGAMGAAFSNLIFCNPACKVLAFVTPFGKRFCIQGNLAGLMGCEYTIFPGHHPTYMPGAEDSNRDLNLLFEGFSIDIEQLRRALANW